MDRKGLYTKLKNIKIENFDIDEDPPKPAGNYVSVKRVGDLAYISGQMPMTKNNNLLQRKINETTLEYGYRVSKLTMANVLKQLVYSEEINEVKSIVRIDGFFLHKNGSQLPKMLNGASDLVTEIFEGENKKHARTVSGSLAIPYDACLMLVVIVEIK
ncbi:RidA family protein [Aureivirga sp. CE67]|uniref:RidA family protein n=1 Tax=Aureivirga sp. CE67 TaxID=1788983 RepID=UPI0018CAA4A1|nr:RidA family protein [Aureivirga sp. CE67]